MTTFNALLNRLCTVLEIAKKIYVSDTSNNKGLYTSVPPYLKATFKTPLVPGIPLDVTEQKRIYTYICAHFHKSYPAVPLSILSRLHTLFCIVATLLHILKKSCDLKKMTDSYAVLKSVHSLTQNCIRTKQSYTSLASEQTQPNIPYLMEDIITTCNIIDNRLLNTINAAINLKIGLLLDKEYKNTHISSSQLTEIIQKALAALALPKWIHTTVSGTASRFTQAIQGNKQSVTTLHELSRTIKNSWFHFLFQWNHPVRSLSGGQCVGDTVDWGVNLLKSTTYTSSHAHPPNGSFSYLLNGHFNPSLNTVLYQMQYDALMRSTTMPVKTVKGKCSGIDLTNALFQYLEENIKQKPLPSVTIIVITLYAIDTLSHVTGFARIQTNKDVTYRWRDSSSGEFCCYSQSDLTTWLTECSTALKYAKTYDHFTVQDITDVLQTLKNKKNPFNDDFIELFKSKYYSIAHKDAASTKKQVLSP